MNLGTQRVVSVNILKGAIQQMHPNSQSYTVVPERQQLTAGAKRGYLCEFWVAIYFRVRSMDVLAWWLAHEQFVKLLGASRLSLRYVYAWLRFLVMSMSMSLLSRALYPHLLPNSRDSET